MELIAPFLLTAKLAQVSNYILKLGKTYTMFGADWEKIS
jgi:hypothetical protein